MHSKNNLFSAVIGKVGKVSTRVQRSWHCGSFGKSYDGVFCNSMQKAGTHYLLGLLRGVKGLGYFEAKTYEHALTRCHDSLSEVFTPQLVYTRLASLGKGELIRGHVEPTPKVKDAIQNLNIPHFLMVRDLRAMLVSLYHWWNLHEEIPCWPFFHFRSLKSTDAKIEFLILGDQAPGVDPEKAQDKPWPDAVSRYCTYSGWLNHQNTLIVRFEDLRDENRRYQECKRIYEHLKRDEPFSEKIFKKMLDFARPNKSRTFRKGSVKGWGTILTEYHLGLLEEMKIQKYFNLFGYSEKK